MPDRELPWTGRVDLGSGNRIHARRCDAPRAGRLRLDGLSGGQVFDADALRPPLRWREARPGDRLRRPDPAGSRSVAELLTEIGVPRSLRGRQPVLEDANGVLWVPGVRRADRAQVGEMTRRLWIVRYRGALPSDARRRGGTSR
jgi:tRNA(Ile)-lysidine synthase